jgi:translation initiation factor 2 gamma subunit (eIF-2gamma)
MEHLIIDLKLDLILKRKNEISNIEEFNKETDKDLILISAGRIIELDFLIKSLEEMINYIEKTKSIQQ